MINAKSGLYSLMLSLMLGMAPAWADVVDISSMNKVEVGSWAELKAAVENSANAGKVIVLTKDITADKDNPITSAGGAGIIIDGGGFTITGQEGSSNGQFINFSSDKTDLIIQNIKFDSFGNVRTGLNARGGAIYNDGTIGDITGDFTGNYAQSTSSFASGGAIFNTGSKATIGDINGDFSGNYAQSTSGSAIGGAIFNQFGSISNIRGDFSGNFVQSDSDYANGGAIYNYGTIGDISGDFSDNYAQSDSFSAIGGAIFNQFGSISNIRGDFSGNFVQSESGIAIGGAIVNYGTINDITGDFTKNYAKSDSDSANGGAIVTDGTLTLTNSSFYDNYVQTGASKDSVEGQLTQGGAIYNAGDLTIRADAGQSIFSGNKVIWADGKDSSAIFQDGGTLTLDSQNNGLIKFDDKITTSNPIKDYLANAQAYGATITDDGEGGYILTYDDGTNQHVIKTDNGFFAPEVSQDGIPQQALEQMLASLPPEFIKQDGDNYIVSGVMDGAFIYSEVIKQENGTYTIFNYNLLTEYGADIVITGDSTSKVEFNNALDGFEKIDISGTNVDVNEGAGTIYRTVTHDGGVLNINAGAKAEDSIINDKGTLNVANTAEIYRTEINSGGTLNVTAGGFAQDTTVNSGGKLSAEAQARLNNMLANGGAILDIDAGSLLTGNIIIHAGATMGGSYDYSQIFKDEVTEDGSLTLVGGLNGAMTESSLINTTEGKRLHLTGGDYVIGDGAQAVKGWDLLTFKDNANVKLEGDITLTGPNKKLIIENGSNLNLAGHSPSNYTITGSVSNDGSMTFSHAGDDADDITTIYGNYTAYNNAQMTIDVNPTENTSDLLRIDGDVAGTTNVVLNVLQKDVRPTELIQFVDAQNDDLSTGAYFKIFRVDGSAFKWNSLYKDNGWYTGTDDLIPDGSENGYGDGDKGNIEDVKTWKMMPFCRQTSQMLRATVAMEKINLLTRVWLVRQSPIWVCRVRVLNKRVI